MEWRDEGIVIGVRRHGESAVLLDLMTRGHGRHMGLVRGGRSSRLQPVLQAGNAVEAVWRARLDEHLGNYTVEPLRLTAARLMASPAALYGLSSLGVLLRLLPERDPHPALYEATAILVGVLDDPDLAGPLMVRFEMAILAEFGFGLDLASCAVTGATEDLRFVSPKSARAVSAAAGEPWRDRLLPLPAFLAEGQGRVLPAPAEVAAGFRLTGHFLLKHVLEPRGLPEPEGRAAFVAAVTSGWA